MLYRNKATRNHIEKNGKVCDTLEVKEDVFYDEELETVLEGLDNNNISGASSEVNEFLKYGGCTVRDKLLKIMNVILEMEGIHNDFKKTLIKPFSKICNKSEWVIIVRPWFL